MSCGMMPARRRYLWLHPKRIPCRRYGENISGLGASIVAEATQGASIIIEIIGALFEVSREGWR